MATLVSHITTTFAEDAIALVTGFGKVTLHLITAPFERIANACDVAGILPRRRAASRMWRAARRGGGIKRRGGLLRYLSPFRALSDLT